LRRFAPFLLLLLAAGACSGRAARPATSPEASGPKLAAAWNVALPIGGEVQMIPVQGGFVLASSAGTVVRVSAADGSILWMKDLGAKVAGNLVAVAGGDAAQAAWAAVSLQGGDVAFLPLESGEPVERWSTGWPSEILSEIGQGALAVSPDGVARLYSPKSSRELWETRLLPPAPASAIVCNGQVLIGLADGRLVGLEPETGKLRWRKKLGSPLAATPGCQGRHALVATEDNLLHALRLHRSRVGRMWFVRSGADPAGAPIFLKKSALLLSKDTFFYGFEESNGHLLFRTRLDRRPGPAAILGDLLLVAGAHATRMDAFRLPSGHSAGGFDLPEGSRFTSPPVVSGGKVAIALARYGEETSRLIALAPAASPEPAKTKKP
jgi:outer membrane protein assembly factor BamB